MTTPFFPSFAPLPASTWRSIGRSHGLRLGTSLTVTGRQQIDIVACKQISSSLIYEITDYDEKKIARTFNHSTVGFMFGTYEMWNNGVFLQSASIGKIRGLIPVGGSFDCVSKYTASDAVSNLWGAGYPVPLDVAEVAAQTPPFLGTIFSLSPIAIMLVLKPTVRLQILGFST